MIGRQLGEAERSREPDVPRCPQHGSLPGDARHTPLEVGPALAPTDALAVGRRYGLWRPPGAPCGTSARASSLALRASRATARGSPLPKRPVSGNAGLPIARAWHTESGKAPSSSPCSSLTTRRRVATCRDGGALYRFPPSLPRHQNRNPPPPGRPFLTRLKDAFTPSPSRKW